MRRHEFLSDTEWPDVCMHCGLPRANQRHYGDATAAPRARVARHHGDPFLAPAAHGSETSAEAAELTLPKSNTDRRRVLTAIREAGAKGLTDDEMIVRTGLAGNTVRPRRSELALAGWIARLEDRQGHRVTRRTAHGRNADVWVLTPAARRMLDHTPQLV